MNWPVIAVIIDDAKEPYMTHEMSSSNEKNELFSSYQEENHIFQIIKLKENLKSHFAIQGFEIEGKFLPYSAKPRKRISFIGDSITCGLEIFQIHRKGVIIHLKRTD